MKSHQPWQEAESVIGMGLMSGTSVDAIDAAIVQIYRDEIRLPSLLHFQSIPFEAALRDIILRISTPGGGAIDEITQVHWALGHAFATAALDAIAQSGMAKEDIRFIASHGQTVHHLPGAGVLGGFPSRGTLQLGEAAVIAERTGILTIADFRAADMAAGGQGAPLVPYFDFTYFRHPTENRALVNIGGIANVTYLPAGAGADEIVAFDCGPGNMLLDALSGEYFNRPYDAGGKHAAAGKIEDTLLRWLQSHPFITRPWPKSTGREEWGTAFMTKLRKKITAGGVGPEDALATVTFFAAKCIADAVQAAAGKRALNRVIVSGGGSLNRTLMDHLKSHCRPAAVVRIDEFNIPSQAKEAICFACLGYATFIGKPGNLPAATGARRKVILGKLSMP